MFKESTYSTLHPVSLMTQSCSKTLHNYFHLSPSGPEGRFDYELCTVQFFMIHTVGSILTMAATNVIIVYSNESD